MINTIISKSSISTFFVAMSFLFYSSLSYSQCGCVWIDASGNLQCIVSPNCGNPQLNACGNQITASNWCDGSNPCALFPGQTGSCTPLCLGNGACFYSSNNCNMSNLVCGVILPVTLVNLEGLVKDGYNEITWSTESENDNSFFEIERSQNGTDWISVIKLPGAGSSQEILNYSLKDEDYKIAINYYRIIQVDFDGERSSYGPISLDNRSNQRELKRTCNMLGQDVDANYRGIVINYYDDGSIEKVWR